MTARDLGTVLFFALLAGAVIAGASTSVHNGATLLALILLAAAMTVGIRIAVLDEHTNTTEPNTTALAEGATR